MPLARQTFIDAEYTDEALTPPVVNGVKMGEGDGTVGLLSLGAMCVEGWKRERWNPAGIKVTTVEVRGVCHLCAWVVQRTWEGLNVLTLMLALVL